MCAPSLQRSLRAYQEIQWQLQKHTSASLSNSRVTNTETNTTKQFWPAKLGDSPQSHVQLPQVGKDGKGMQPGLPGSMVFGCVW